MSIFYPEDLFAKITKLGDQFVIFIKLRGQIVIFQKSFLLCLFDCLFEICELIVFLYPSKFCKFNFFYAVISNLWTNQVVLFCIFIIALNSGIEFKIGL